jgi:hypothetical protein
MTHRRCAACFLAFCLALVGAAQTGVPTASADAVSAPAAPIPAPISFTEVWAYVMAGEEKYIDSAFPITDLCHFGASLDSYGKLTAVPDRKKLGDFSGRAHLVVAELGNYALTHFCLDPGFPLREQLLSDIVNASLPYDGVQIDFEAVLSKDYDLFFSFVSDLKTRLGGKILSVALPARITEKTDYFGYARMAGVVDRIIVMAYDEHWSSSAAGPIASIEWCSKVAEYARSKVPPEKLVMGNPFYGRAWADKSLSRAYKHSAISSLVAEKRIEKIEREDWIPFFEYVETVTVRAYFEDAVSTFARLSLYSSVGTKKVAFWRLGQEDGVVWKFISIADQPPPESSVVAPAGPAG